MVRAIERAMSALGRVRPGLPTSTTVSEPGSYCAGCPIRRSAWGRGPMRIKAGVTQIWVFCVPAVASVIGDGMCPVAGERWWAACRPRPGWADPGTRLSGDGGGP